MPTASTKLDRGAVVVTGVSTGLGRAAAELLLNKGFSVFGSVRRLADASTLLTASYLGRFRPLVFDLADTAAIGRAAAEVGGMLDGECLKALVHNAGMAVAAPLLHQPEMEFARHLDINVTGAFRVVQAFAPLVAGGSRTTKLEGGHIVLMSSISGVLATPFLGAYAASKHALEGYADTLWRELVALGVDVIVVGPSGVATPIWDKAEAADAEPYAATLYGPALARFRQTVVKARQAGLPASKVAEVVLIALTAHRPKARYSIMSKALVRSTLPRLMTKRMLDKVLARRIGLSHRS